MKKYNLKISRITYSKQKMKDISVFVPPSFYTLRATM